MKKKIAQVQDYRPSECEFHPSRSLHGGSGVGGLGPRRRQKGVGILRLPSGIPIDALLGRRHRKWHGNAPHLQNQRRIPRQNYEHLLSRTISQGTPFNHLFVHLFVIHAFVCSFVHLLVHKFLCSSVIGQN